MATQNDLGFVTLLVTPAAGISAFTVVALNSDGSISPATGSGATLRGVGVTQEGAIAGRYVNTKLWGAPGTFGIQVSPGQPVTPGSQYGISNGYAVAPGTTSGSTTPYLQGGPLAGVSGAGVVVEFYEL